jgi:hypothetical protein
MLFLPYNDCNEQVYSCKNLSSAVLWLIGCSLLSTSEYCPSDDDMHTIDQELPPLLQSAHHTLVWLPLPSLIHHLAPVLIKVKNIFSSCELLKLFLGGCIAADITPLFL